MNRTENKNRSENSVTGKPPLDKSKGGFLRKNHMKKNFIKSVKTHNKLDIRERNNYHIGSKKNETFLKKC